MDKQEREGRIQIAQREKNKHSAGFGAAMELGKVPLAGILAAPALIYHGVKEHKAMKKIEKLSKGDK